METRTNFHPTAEQLLDYLHDKLPADLRRQIDVCLESDDQLRGTLRDMRHAEAMAQDIFRMESIDKEAGYRRITARIHARSRELWRRRATQWAAVLMLPLLVCSLLMSYLYYKERFAEVQYAEISTPAGSVGRYELPDGSVVWLNAESRLRYPMRFRGSSREVELQGEAYFKVEANPSRPFYVHTDAGLSLYVYGTAFNVNAYADEPEIKTILEEGRVNLLIPGTDSETVLRPDECITYDRASGSITRSAVHVADEVAWRSGKLVFRNAPLDEVLHRLSRHFNVDIEFRNHTTEEFRYRATFRNETLDQIFDYLSNTANIRWKVTAPERCDGETFTRRQILVEQY